MSEVYLSRQNPIPWTREEEVRGASGATVGDFWTWAYSDILGNTNRGVFAEYLVARGLLGEVRGCRREWDAFDVSYRGFLIEVKSAAYAQTWKQRKASNITFDIAKKQAWFAESDTWDSTPKRSSDCYVFCVFESLGDDLQRKILDVSCWNFTIVPTKLIDQKLGDQRTVSYGKVKKLGASSRWSDLRRVFRECMKPYSDRSGNKRKKHG